MLSSKDRTMVSYQERVMLPSEDNSIMAVLSSEDSIMLSAEVSILLSSENPMIGILFHVFNTMWLIYRVYIVLYNFYKDSCPLIG